MTASRRPLRAASCALFAWLAVVASPSLSPVQAQSSRTRSDTLSARVRDSIIADVLADTLDMGDEAEPQPAQPFRQTLTLRPTFRRYSVGEVDAAEQASYIGWVGRFPRGSLRVDLTPLAYRGDTTAKAGRPPVSFGGVTPAMVRLDLKLRSRDTLRLFAQSASSPMALTPAQTSAISAVGTSTIDLDASSLGIASRVGMRYAVTQPLGESGMALTVRTGVEYDPKPSGTEAVSWRGTTVRGLLGVSHADDATTIGTSVEVTRSFTDSLNGRNLFPGGGQLTLDARFLRNFGDDGVGFVSVTGFYSKPIDLQRPDVATRLIPIGDFAGITGTSAIPVGALTVLPVVSVLRESSSARATVNGRNASLQASGTTATASVGLAIPVGRYLTVTPEVGGATGTVGQTVSAQFPRRVRSTGFSDPIRGGWVSLEVSIAR